jgi:predicted Zn-ribbon and HTH transcriptional regulator
MESKILLNKTRLLEIAQRKLNLLESLIKQIEHIENNDVLIEEIEEAYLDLYDDESELILEEEKTVDCPDCGFTCSQIHSYCMACGSKLSEQYHI